MVIRQTNTVQLRPVETLRIEDKEDQIMPYRYSRQLTFVKVGDQQCHFVVE